MVFWIYLFPLLILSAIPAYIAQTKGKSFGTWYVYSILLLPIALIHSLVIKKDSAEMESRSLLEGNKKCPYCAELVLRDGWEFGRLPIFKTLHPIKVEYFRL